jgi:serine/threonine protein kinase
MSIGSNSEAGPSKKAIKRPPKISREEFKVREGNLLTSQQSQAIIPVLQAMGSKALLPRHRSLGDMENRIAKVLNLRPADYELFLKVAAREGQVKASNLVNIKQSALNEINNKIKEKKGDANALLDEKNRLEAEIKELKVKAEVELVESIRLAALLKDEDDKSEPKEKEVRQFLNYFRNIDGDVLKDSQKLEALKARFAEAKKHFPNGELPLQVIKDNNGSVYVLHDGCEIDLLSNLPNSDANQAKSGILYLSKDGQYVARDTKGVVHEDYLPSELVIRMSSVPSEKDLVKEFMESRFRNAVLEFTSGRGHTLRDAALLGKGNFGSVVVSQAIYSKSADVVPFEYYAVKSQEVSRDEGKDAIRYENSIARDLNQNFGELDGGNVFYSVMPIIKGKELSHVVESYISYVPPKKGPSKEEVEFGNLFEEHPDDVPLPQKPEQLIERSEIKEAESSSADEAEDEAYSSFVAKSDSGPELQNFGTFVGTDDDSKEEEKKQAVGTFVAIEEAQAFGTFVANEEDSKQEEAQAFRTFVANEEDSKQEEVQAFGTFVAVKSDSKGKEEDSKEEKKVVPISEKEKEKEEAIGEPEIKMEEPDPLFEIECALDPNDFEIESFIDHFDGLAEQIEFLHSKGIIHLDVKPENFMYDPESKEHRAIDFGTSQRLIEVDSKKVGSIVHETFFPDLTSPAQQQKYKNDLIGTPVYMAPEILEPQFNGHYTTKQDIYSLGRSFELMCHGKIQSMTRNDGYVNRAPSVLVPSHLVKMTTTPHMRNIQFRNDTQDPRIEAMNQLLTLIYQTRDRDLSRRPEASEIRRTLAEIKAKLDQSFQSSASAVLEKSAPAKIEISEKAKSTLVNAKEHKFYVALLSQLVHERHELEQERNKLIENGTPLGADEIFELDKKIASKDSQIRIASQEVRNYERKLGMDAPPIMFNHHVELQNQKHEHQQNSEGLQKLTSFKEQLIRFVEKYSTNDEVKKVGQFQGLLTRFESFKDNRSIQQAKRMLEQIEAFEKAVASDPNISTPAIHQKIKDISQSGVQANRGDPTRSAKQLIEVCEQARDSVQMDLPKRGPERKSP